MRFLIAEEEKAYFPEAQQLVTPADLKYLFLGIARTVTVAQGQGRGR